MQLLLFSRFCFSSIEQQYVAESLQTMSRQHAAKSSGKGCNSTTSAGKRRMRGKLGQSGNLHKGAIMESGASCDFEGEEEIDQTTGKRAGTELNESHVKDKRTVATTCRHISMEQGVKGIFGKKEKTDKVSQIEINATVVEKECGRRHSHIPSSTSPSQLLMWYGVVISIMNHNCFVNPGPNRTL